MNNQQIIKSTPKREIKTKTKEIKQSLNYVLMFLGMQVHFFAVVALINRLGKPSGLLVMSLHCNSQDSRAV